MGYQLIVGSLGGLLDQAVSVDVRAQIDATIKAHGNGALQVHDVRTRQSGQVTFIEFHLVVPGSLSVDDAHVICDRLETALMTAIRGADVTIHVEPGDKAKQDGALSI